MIRYDKLEDVPKEVSLDDVSSREKVKVDKVHQKKIKDLFLKKMKNLEIEHEKVIKSITNENIVFNDKVTLKMLTAELGQPVQSKVEFIKDMYIALIDNIIDEVYGRPVISIQEAPYMFNSVNENVVKYEFID